MCIRDSAYSQEVVSEDGYTRVSVPVNYNGNQVGLLTLIYDNSERNLGGIQYWRLLITFLISISIITAIILLLIQHFTTRPIGNLANFARRISLLKEYDERLPDAGRSDEIGTLSAAINDMLDTIGEGRQRIEKHAGNLESLVDQRTAQLNLRANYDQLTGLPNRYQLMDRMDQMLSDAERLNHRLASVS